MWGGEWGGVRGAGRRSSGVGKFFFLKDDKAYEMGGAKGDGFEWGKQKESGVPRSRLLRCSDSDSRNLRTPSPSSMSESSAELTRARRKISLLKLQNCSSF